MSARDDLVHAADEARSQVASAREALAASRATGAGAGARSARQAEQQLHELRGAVADDVRALRDRLSALDPSARRGATTAAVVGAGTLAALVGSGVAVRGRVRRALRHRDLERQALAIAGILAGGSARPASAGPTLGGRTGRRGGRGALVALLAVGAAVAGAALVQQQRALPVDDEDLWLPERGLGPV